MLRQRVLTALVLVAILGAALYFVPAPTLWVVFALIVAIAGWEWGGLIKLPPIGRVVYGVAVFSICAALYIYAPALITILISASCLFWFAVVPVWLRSRTPLGTGFAGMGLGLFILTAGWSALTVLQSKSSWLLLVVMVLVWVADVFAYFAGRKFGHRKLAPTISPGKTWEGVAGAIAGVAVYGMVLLHSPWGTYWRGGVVLAVLLLPVLTAVSIVGDLLESMLKRQAGMKDSSNLLPGHGGVLDRIDSLLSTLPAAALVLILST